MAQRNIRLNIADYAPADEAWKNATKAERRRALTRLGEIALFRKKREIVRGIGVDGKKFRPVKPASRPDGADGAPLNPHYADSRTTKLLAFVVGEKGVTLFWRGHGRKSWATILGYHADGMVRGAPVRDTIGISSAGIRAIKRDFADWWKTRTRTKAKGTGSPPKPVAKPPAPKPVPLPPPPVPVVEKPKPAPVSRTVGKVIYLAKGQKPNHLSKKVQVYETTSRKPKGGAPPEAKPKPPAPLPPPKPTPIVPTVVPPKPVPKPVPPAPRPVVLKPVAVPTPKPLPPAPKVVAPKPVVTPIPAPKPVPKPPPAKVVSPPPPPVPKPVVVPPPKPPVVAPTPPPAPKPPPASAPTVESPADFHKRMLPRVDAEIKKLVDQYVIVKPAFDQADARYQAVKLTHGKDSPEGRAAKKAAQEAFARMDEVVATGQRFEAWKKDFKTNPLLIPPFEAKERLEIYARRGGAEKLKRLQSLAKGDENPEAKIDEIHRKLREIEDKFKKAPERSDERRRLNDEHMQIAQEEAKLTWDKQPAAPPIAKVIEALSPGKGIAIKADFAPPGVIKEDVEMVSKNQLPVIADALAYLRQVFSHAGLPEITVPIGRLPRGSRDRSFCNKKGIALEEETETRILIHEIGHHLETHTGMGHAAQGFLKYRVGDEEPQRMADLFPRVGYGPTEMGRKDKFEDVFGERSAYYVGKDYGAAGTEITSMGMEKFFEDPVALATKDPEYTSFLLGLMDGSLR